MSEGGPRRLAPTRRALLLSLAALAVGRRAGAAPSPGASLPDFTVADVTGQPHSSAELVGRPALVLVMTDTDADAAMRAWGVEADRRVAGSVRRVQFVALDIAGIVPTALARSIARDQAPEHTWHDTWFCRDGAFRASLGLPESETPWAIVLDARGRVAAMVHGFVSSAGADRVWSALGT